MRLDNLDFKDSPCTLTQYKDQNYSTVVFRQYIFTPARRFQPQAQYQIDYRLFGLTLKRMILPTVCNLDSISCSPCSKLFARKETPKKSIQTAAYWAGFGQNVKKRAIKTGLHRSDYMENGKENRHTSSSGVETLPPSTQYSVTIANSLPSVSIKGT